MGRALLVLLPSTTAVRFQIKEAAMTTIQFGFSKRQPHPSSIYFNGTPSRRVDLNTSSAARVVTGCSCSSAQYLVSLYTGGWNISSRHYMASVAFSAAPVFAFAAVWFLAFALAGLAFCCCRCCRGKTVSDYTYFRKTFAVSLLLLLAFTAAAVIGCAVLYDGQGKLDGSTSATLRYVVNQSDGAAASLRGFAGSIETAKGAGGAYAALPPDLGREVDEVARRVGAASTIPSCERRRPAPVGSPACSGALSGGRLLRRPAPARSGLLAPPVVACSGALRPAPARSGLLRRPLSSSRTSTAARATSVSLVRSRLVVSV